MDFFKINSPVSVGNLVTQIDLPARIAGDPSRQFSGVASLEKATPDALCFCANIDDLANNKTAAAVIICPDHFSQTQGSSQTIILTANPMLYFVKVLNLFFRAQFSYHTAASAVVEAEAKVASDVSVGHFALIQSGACVESGCIIECGAKILRGSVIGRNSRIGANAVIGAEGLAFAKEDASYEAMPHLGQAVLRENVWVGANSTVVKGILTDTILGRGTKVGSQVNIGHNVKIGENCFIAAAAILCGSSRIGDRVWLAAGSVILNRVNVGDDVLVGIGAVVSKDVAPGTSVMGFPARPIPKI